MKPSPSQQPLSITQVILHLLLVYAVSLVVFDLIGVAVVFLAEVLLTRSRSGALFYAIWIVAAVFHGLMYFSFVYETAKRNAWVAGHNWIVPVVTLLLTALTVFLLNAAGQLQAYRSYDPDHFVPGNRGLTLTYFITFTAAVFFFHNMENWQLQQGQKKH